jgi:hypothetical protein
MLSQIKLHVPGGWSSTAREHMIDQCTDRALPFVDVDGVADRTLMKSGIQVIKYKAGMPLPENYIFFGHRHLEDLPFNITLCKAS